jgi:hypothetical protein
MTAPIGSSSSFRLLQYGHSTKSNLSGIGFLLFGPLGPYPFVTIAQNTKEKYACKGLKMGV